jgi:hypothetical protein
LTLPKRDAQATQVAPHDVSARGASPARPHGSWSAEQTLPLAVLLRSSRTWASTGTEETMLSPCLTAAACAPTENGQALLAIAHTHLASVSEAL